LNFTLCRIEILRDTTNVDRLACYSKHKIEQDGLVDALSPLGPHGGIVRWLRLDRFFITKNLLNVVDKTRSWVDVGCGS